ncbi:MAG: glycosyltransferase family 2 protein [Eubacteriales bacterium]|nr:glycosyltransferase family 2 protein [Eubacteriales bacterium]
MTNDLVSVIMPSYNCEAYIEASIRSVLAQTYENWELLIVDDCSTDGTVPIVQSFRDDRIKLFFNERNSGAAVSRNRALREARGRWIAFLDSDDLWHPEKLERQISYMEKNGYAFSCTDYRINLNGTWLSHVNTGPMAVDRRRMYRYCYFSTITVIYDRNVAGLIQIGDLRKNNDYAMWLRVIEKCNCYRLPQCLSFYIKHDNSVSGGRKWKLIKWHYRLFRQEQEKGVLPALYCTARNLFFGVIKKAFFKHSVTSAEQKLTEETVLTVENIVKEQEKVKENVAV